jgi:malate synthase
MSTPNQIHKNRDDVTVKAADLLAFSPEKPITEHGLRMNINVGLQYLGSWLAGVGCVPIYNLMEDAATAEIARSQIWQWIRSPKGVLEDGRKVTQELFREFLPQELAKIRQELGDKQFDQVGRYGEAARIFDEITTNNDFVEFFTLPGYAHLNQAA